jgi:hypothetical protein
VAKSNWILKCWRGIWGSCMGCLHGKSLFAYVFYRTFKDIGGYRTLCSLGFLVIGSGLTHGPLHGQKSRLSPFKVTQIKKGHLSFNKCKKDALREFKRENLSDENLKQLLTACSERFPTAKMLLDCKKKALETAKRAKQSPNKNLQRCKKWLIAATFDPDEPLPFYKQGQRIFFAGIGLNSPLDSSALNLPNFDCKEIENAMSNIKRAAYILFGNHPRVFQGLNKIPMKRLMKEIGFKRPRQNGVDTKLGRIFGKLNESRGELYFPTMACSFNNEPGTVFSGLSIYYLLDPRAHKVHPYFGIAYYSEKQKKVKKSALTKMLSRMLGKSFKILPKNKRVKFFAESQITERDAEKDPKNLCRKPRNHRMVAVIQAKESAPKNPDYLLVANIESLCSFGDQMAKYLLK